MQPKQDPRHRRPQRRCRQPSRRPVAGIGTGPHHRRRLDAGRAARCPSGRRTSRPRTRQRRHLRRRRLRRRHRPDHGSHGRLRRLRRAADPGPGRGLQRLRPDPVGADRDRHRVQPPRRHEPQAHRAGPVARSTSARSPTGTTAQIKKLNKGVNAAEPEDHARLPQRRLRRHVRLHRLPLARQPDAGRARSASPRRSASRPASAARATTASPRVVGSTNGAIGYISASYIIAHHLRGRGAAEHRRQVRVPEPAATSRPPASVVKKVPANNEMHIVNPPQDGARSPTRCRRSRTRSCHARWPRRRRSWRSSSTR